MQRLLASCALAGAFALLSGCATYQTITVQSVPSGADISLNTVPRGQAPVKLRLLVDSFMGMGRAPYEIVASKPGYEDKKISINSDSFVFNNARPYPDPLVITLGGHAAPAPSPAASAPRHVPVSRLPKELKKEAKKESWR